MPIYILMFFGITLTFVSTLVAFLFLFDGAEIKRNPKISLILFTLIFCFWTFVGTWCKTTEIIQSEYVGQLKTFDGADGSKFQIVYWNDSDGDHTKRLTNFWENETTIIVTKSYEYSMGVKTDYIYTFKKR